MRQAAGLLVVGALLLPGAGAATAAPIADPPGAARVTATDGEGARASRAPRRPTRSGGVYRTPGYRGLRRVPRTGPAPAPPSVVLSGHGWKPDVLVDAAGTAHVVWVETVDAAGNDVVDDVVRYCRLPRGATACSNPSTVPFDPALTPSDDFAGPRILQIGEGLVILTSRYPAVRTHPDGETSDRALYASTSTDGGTTWSPPGIVGTQAASGDALVWGGAAPRISVISDTQTGGTVAQTVVPGAYTRPGALLGPGDEAYSGRLALDGDRPAAAFSALAGYGVVRVLVPGGDPQDPNAWTRALVPDANVVRLAGGPKGVVLLSRPLAGGPFVSRPVVDGVPGAATALPEPPGGTGPLAEVVQDPSGHLETVYRDGIGSRLFKARSEDGGRSWSPIRLVAEAATPGGGVDDLAIAAAADGGGVTAYRRDATGLTTGTVAVSAFGTLSPTGRPGVGGLAGGGVPGAVAGCDEASVGALKAVPLLGCFLPSVDPQYPGAVVTQGDVDLNGLIVRPDPGVRIVLDPRRRRIDTTGRVRVILRGAGLDVTLFHDRLQMQLPATGSGATLFDIAPGNISLAGFPIKGRVKVLLTPTGVRIPLSLALPGAFGGVTGDATVIAESGRGVRLDSLKLAVRRAPIGPMELRDLLVSYAGEADTWRGAATLGLPPQPGGAALGADVTFVGGRFTMGNFSVAPPWPGVPVGPKVFLTGVRGGFGLDPIRISVGASFGALQIPPSSHTVSVDGDMELLVQGDTVLLRFTGTGKIVGVSMSRVSLRATTDGYADLDAAYEIDLVVAALKGSLQGFLDGPRGQFGATADAQVTVGPVAATGQRAAISNRGVGACYTLLGASAYVGYRFGEPIPDGARIGVGCNLSEFEIPRPMARAAAAPGGSTFTVAPGTTIQNVELTTAAGSPTVLLRAPDGTVVAPVDAVATGSLAAPVSSLALPAANRALLVLRGPVAGTWAVVPVEGSPGLTRLRVARELPATGVTASVARRGSRRVLRYRVRAAGGATVRFTERGPGGAVRDLGAARGAAGSLTFTPADGPAGRREIVAFVERGGVPVQAPVVARYTAPAVRRLPVVRGVRAQRSGRAVTVRWRGVTGPVAGYVVRVRGRTSGRVLARVVGARTRMLRVTGVSADDGRLTVTVAARDRRGRSGRSGRATARG